MTWDKDTEVFLNDFRSGRIQRIRDDLEGILFPFDFDNVEKVAQDWVRLGDYEDRVADYREAALEADGEDDSETFRNAFKDIIFIDKRIKAKRDFAYDSLENAIVEYEERFSKDFKSADIRSLQESKESLRRIIAIADAVRYEKVLEYGRGLEAVCDEKIGRLREQRNNDRERSLAYEDLLNEAQEGLSGSASARRLRDIRQRLRERGLASGDGEERSQIDEMIERYDTVIDERRSMKQGRLRRSLLKGAAAVTVIGALYLGVGAVGDLRERMRLRSEQRQERMLSETHHPAPVTASYAASLTTGSSLDGVLTGDKRAIIDHLSPVLGRQPVTLYVEKGSDKSYIIERGRSGSEVVYGPFSHTDGSDPSPKEREGQRSTPEGIYHIMDLRYFGDRKVAPFGRGFYRIDYPNAADKLAGRTGSGVGLCSAADYRVEQAIRDGRDVMHSGVAFSDDDFERVRSIIGDGSSTQVVIEDYGRRPLPELGR